MDIGTEKAEHVINVGSASNLFSLYSTAVTLMGNKAKRVSLGLGFLEKGVCASRDCAKALKQLVAISEELSNHSPDDAIWDIEHPNVVAPWVGHLSPDITNCADLYTTSEGDPLLPELRSLLQYAGSTQQAIVVLG